MSANITTVCYFLNLRAHIVTSPSGHGLSMFTIMVSNLAGRLGFKAPVTLPVTYGKLR